MSLDLHIHSKYSVDSVSPIRSIVNCAQRRGLNGIAVTDHNTIKGGVEARKVNCNPDFVVIVGAEISTESGDILGLFLTEEIKARESLQVIDEIHKQGGIAILPHPFKGHLLSDELIKKIDMVEAANARTSEYQNKKALELAQRWGKPVTAGSDAHFVKEIGAAKMIIPQAISESDIREALLNNKNELACVCSPKYLERMSQMIKVVKTRQFIKAARRLVAIAGNKLSDIG